MRLRTEGRFLACVLVGLLTIWSVFASGPFVRHREHVSAMWAKFAVNHLKFGYQTTRLGHLNVCGPSLERYDNWRTYYYPTRPFLPSVLLSLGFHIAGTSESAYRLILGTFASFGVILFHLLALRLMPSAWDARFCTLVYAGTTLFVYFSTVVAFLAFVLPVCIAGVLVYLHWRERPTPTYVIWCYGLLLAACLIDWIGYYACLGIAMVDFVTRASRRWIALGFIGVGVVAFFLHLGHLWLLEPDGQMYVRGVFGQGAQRMSLAGRTVVQYALGELREICLYLGPAVMITALIGVSRLVQAPGSVHKWTILTMGVWGIESVIFPFNSVLDDYMTYPLIPFFALAAGTGLAWMSRLPRTRPLVAVLLAAMMTQSAFVSWNRFTKEGALRYELQALMATKEKTMPQQGVLLATHMTTVYDGYYLDRYSYKYDPRTGILYCEAFRGGRQLSAKELVEWARDSGLDFVVAAVKGITDQAPDVQAVIPGSGDSATGTLLEFGIYDPEHEFIRELEAAFPDKSTHRGFVFYRIER